MLQISSIYKNPLFYIGLLIRALLLNHLVNSKIVLDWYAPFLENSVRHFSFDPWTAWLASNGQPEAFPYGYAMWLLFLPSAIFAKYFGIASAYSYAATLLASDFVMLHLLKIFSGKSSKFILLTYWLSPILILGTYYLGYNDIIPVLFLTGSLFFIRKKEVLISGLLLACAISAKLSMALVIPFYLIYFLHNKTIRSLGPAFLASFLASIVLFEAPFVLSNSAIFMLLSNPEIPKLYQLSLKIGEYLNFFITPAAYLATIYIAWSVKRINFDLFLSMLGISLLTVVLLTPSSLGWFIWTLPLLVYFQKVEGKKAFFICTFFSALYISNVFIGSYFNADFSESYWKITSLSHTLLITTGVILITLIWKATIKENDFFKLSRKPFAIGISGDSGSGKDTLSNAILGLFGKHSVTQISGDDYHQWDRHKPIWNIVTHLNPLANDLSGFTRDLLKLSTGRSIRSRYYNHDTGKLTTGETLPSNDIVLASGLHTLHLPVTRELLDLKIFLNIDEELRRFLKIKRDVHQRGYTQEKVLESIERRLRDSNMYIAPQMKHADICFMLEPSRRDAELLEIHNEHLKLSFFSRLGIDQYEISRTLIGICGLHVDSEVIGDLDITKISIEGNPSAEDIQLAAEILCKRTCEFLDLNPQWEAGTLGLMQLITAIHIEHILNKRYYDQI